MGVNEVSNTFFKKIITKLLLFQIFLLLFFIIADKICYVETERQNFLATNTRQHNIILNLHFIFLDFSAHFKSCFTIAHILLTLHSASMISGKEHLREYVQLKFLQINYYLPYFSSFMWSWQNVVKIVV